MKSFRVKENILKKNQIYKTGQILISERKIRKRVKEVAKEITLEYKNKNILILGVLKGACILISDLISELHKMGLTDLNLTFITVNSYGAGTVSNKLKLRHDIDISPMGRNVLIVDDVIDTGKSLDFIHKLILKGKPASVKSFALLDKPSRRIAKYNADYVGFKIPDIWVQGYGMDTDEIGRGKENIMVGPYKY